MVSTGGCCWLIWKKLALGSPVSARRCSDTVLLFVLEQSDTCPRLNSGWPRSCVNRQMSCKPRLLICRISAASPWKLWKHLWMLNLSPPGANGTAFILCECFQQMKRVYHLDALSWQRKVLWSKVCDTHPPQAADPTVRGNITAFVALTKTWINRRPSDWIPQLSEAGGTEDFTDLRGDHWDCQGDGFKHTPRHSDALRERRLMICGIWTLSLMALIIF